MEYHGPVWMSYVEFHLGLLDSVVHSAERFCEGEPLFGAQKEGQCLVFAL